MGSNGTAPSNGGAPRADSAAAGLASTGSAQPNSVAVQAQQQQQQAATGGGYRFDRQALVEEQRRKQEVYAAAQALVDRIIKPLAMDVKLHELKRRTRDLGELGITSEQVEDVVSRTGMGPASLNSLRNLVVTAQVQRRGISAAQQQQQQLLQPGSAARLNAPATAAPLAAVQQAMQQQQQPPPQPLQQLRQQEHQQQPAAAAAAASRRPAPGWGQPGRVAGAASSLSTGGAAATQAAQQEPSSSEVDDDEASSGSRNRTPGSKSSIRDLLNEERIWLPSYAPGSYNHQLCPACQGGSSGEKSLSVTVEEGGQAAVWNCFRAKCGWAGGVSLAKQQRGGRQKQQYTNDQGRRGGAGPGSRTTSRVVGGGVQKQQYANDQDGRGGARRAAWSPVLLFWVAPPRHTEEVPGCAHQQLLSVLTSTCTDVLGGGAGESAAVPTSACSVWPAVRAVEGRGGRPLMPARWVGAVQGLR